jgi:hypothetical protein
MQLAAVQGVSGTPAGANGLAPADGFRSPETAPAGGPTRWERRWLLVLAWAVGLLVVYERRQTDPDFWGHLAYGRFFATQGAPGSPDPFAYTSAGCSWRAHEWLAQWLLWQAYHQAGVLGLLALKCLLGGVAIYFLGSTLRQCCPDPRLWVPLFLLTAGMVGRWFLFRPQLFTFCFLAYYLSALHAHLDGRSLPWKRLVLLMVLWANVHGGFLAGLGVLGLGLGLRNVQRIHQSGWRWRPAGLELAPLAGAFLLCLAATLLTPFGGELWRYLATELTQEVNHQYLDEWMPLWRPRHVWSAATFVFLSGLLLATGLLTLRRPRQIAGLPAWLWLLSCAPLVFLACRSVRHVPVGVLWMAPVLARLLGAAAQVQGASRFWQRAWLATCGLIGIPVLLGSYFTLSDLRPRLVTQGMPDKVVAFFRSQQLRGNVYAPLEWGSYLTWELYPQVRVALDGRNVTLFPPSLVRESLRFYLEGHGSDVPLHYPTDYLLAPAASPIVPRICQDPHWRLLYADDQALLWARRQPQTSLSVLPSPQEKKNN